MSGEADVAGNMHWLELKMRELLAVHDRKCDERVRALDEKVVTLSREADVVRGDLSQALAERDEARTAAQVQAAQIAALQKELEEAELHIRNSMPTECYDLGHRPTPGMFCPECSPYRRDDERVEAAQERAKKAAQDLDAAVKAREESEAQLAKVRHDRDEMTRVHDEVEADRDQLREENARLLAADGLVVCSKHGQNVLCAGCRLCSDEERAITKALLGNAVAVLERAYCWVSARLSEIKVPSEASGVLDEICAIITDATATAAADAYRDQ